jgi:hypothetical protein
MPAHLDVIIGSDAGAAPLRVLIAGAFAGSDADDGAAEAAAWAKRSASARLNGLSFSLCPTMTSKVAAPVRMMMHSWIIIRGPNIGPARAVSFGYCRPARSNFSSPDLRCNRMQPGQPEQPEDSTATTGQR